MPSTNSVITIGRQYGSGGRFIGEMLANRLDIPFYDKAILTEAARASGICEELFQQNDEKPTRSLLFSMFTGGMTSDISGYMGMPLQHKLFLAQFDAIRRIAAEGPCVIVGRCADYVLRDQVNAVTVFLKAPMQNRVARAIERGADPLKAEDVVRRADKQRSSYYNYYATATWGDVANYDLCIDTSMLGYEGTVDLLEQFVKMRDRALLLGRV